MNDFQAAVRRSKEHELAELIFLRAIGPLLTREPRTAESVAEMAFIAARAFLDTAERSQTTYTVVPFAKGETL